jgi:CHASE2 domain-containing sensor protein
MKMNDEIVSKLVVLKLDGDLEQQGFRVTLEIGLEGDRPYTEMAGSLPPEPELATYLTQWQKQYRSLGMPTRIKPKEIIYEGSIKRFEKCRQIANRLRDRLNLWLESEAFRPLDKRLREELTHREPVRILLRTSDRRLHKLPWHCWDFIEHYPQAEVVFGMPMLERVETATKATKEGKVRILAILGNSHGIDLEADRKLLEALPNAEVLFLVEPKRQEIGDRLWEDAWDILFFAGHSETETEKGRIYLNPQESLTIEELKYALKRAIATGLKIAIFNSCDGLGLARELEQLPLSQIIVMREPVPDQIAQEFLKYFLNAFSGGNSCCEAVRHARERLQGWEHGFPCASWLPASFQHPSIIPLNWRSLLKAGGSEREAQTRRSGEKNNFSQLCWRFSVAFVVGFLSTSAVVGVRSLGLLQTWELQAFDRLMQLRPAEESDRRILVVTIEEADIQYQQQQGMRLRGSLSDTALAQLLEKLAPHQPKVIGSDIIHDFPYEPPLAANLKQTPQFVAICRIGNSSSDLVSIAPPPTLASQQLGFTNFALDPDETIRRQIVGMAADGVCTSDRSFSLQLALRYLQNPSVKLTSEGLSIDRVLFKQLEHNSGGYQLSFQDALGYQILVNFRASPPQQISLKDILNSNHSQLAKLVKDRIILIGVTGAKQDVHSTPYSSMSGVTVHAQMTSQILSAVLDGRSLIWWWAEWIEVLWIGSWSLVGGAIVLRWRTPIHRGIAAIAALSLLSGSCFILLLAGAWIPLVPSAMALIATGALCMGIDRKDILVNKAIEGRVGR